MDQARQDFVPFVGRATLLAQEGSEQNRVHIIDHLHSTLSLSFDHRFFLKLFRSQNIDLVAATETRITLSFHIPTILYCLDTYLSQFGPFLCLWPNFTKHLTISELHPYVYFSPDVHELFLLFDERKISMVRSLVRKRKSKSLNCNDQEEVGVFGAENRHSVRVTNQCQNILHM